jgi:hypothetical protein
MAQAKDASGKVSGTALTGPELEDALARGGLDQPKTQLTGMVKASTKSGYIGFTLAGCDSWVDLPTSLVAEALQVGHQPCEGHSHPLFRLTLNEPKDPEAKALIGLLPARSSASFMPVMPPANMPMAPPGNASMMSAPNMSMNARASIGGFAPGGGGNAARQPQCSTWCSGSTLVCACPVYVPFFGWTYAIYPCGTCINDPIFTAFTAIA